MKKLSLLISSLVFLFLFFSFPLLSNLWPVYAASTYLYDNVNKVGIFRFNCQNCNSFAFIPESLWLDPNGLAALDVGSCSSCVPNAMKEIIFKVGNSPWQAGNVTKNSFVTQVPSNCGIVWGNVRWRSITDGQLHYGNLSLPVYNTGPVVNPASFINDSCLATKSCTYNASSNTGGIDSSIDIRFRKGNQTCTDYSLSCDWGSGGRAWEQLRLDGSIDCIAYCSGTARINNDFKREVFLNPPPPATSSVRVYGHMQLFYFISNTTCGGCQNCGSVITPTPTPRSLSACPYTLSQTIANAGYNLGTGYSPGASVPFTPSFSAGVNKIEIYGGKHAVASDKERSITCKVQTGSTILGEATTALLDAAAAWRELNFSSTMWLTSGTTYTLYCRQTSGSNFQTYWMFSQSSGVKTYRIYLDLCK